MLCKVTNMVFIFLPRRNLVGTRTEILEMSWLHHFDIPNYQEECYIWPRNRARRGMVQFFAVRL